MSVQYVPITPDAILICSRIGYESFAVFSASVSLPPEFNTVEEYAEFVTKELTLESTYTCMAVLQQESPQTDNPNYCASLHGVILGSVIMNCCDEICGIGPISVSTQSQKGGVGAQLMQRCMSEAAQRGLPARLCNIVANINAFSLYCRLGFTAREYMIHIRGGTLNNTFKQDMQHNITQRHIVVRPLTHKDIPTCNAMYLATNGFNRTQGITHGLDVLTESDHAPYGLSLVAENKAGRIVGYCGTDIDSFWIGETDDIILMLYYTACIQLQQESQQDNTTTVDNNNKKNTQTQPDIQIIGTRYPSLLQRLLLGGARALRQICLMSIGEYVAPHRFVYCPSIVY